MLLRKVRQKEGESVQVYAERIMSLAEDAFGGQGMQNQAIQDQLIGFFTDGDDDELEFNDASTLLGH